MSYITCVMDGSSKDELKGLLRVYMYEWTSAH